VKTPFKELNLRGQRSTLYIGDPARGTALQGHSDR
jgi:hypothetical protein